MSTTRQLNSLRVCKLYRGEGGGVEPVEEIPQLSNPYISFTIGGPTLVEVGSVSTLTFNTTFNRGKINPAYGTSGFRSGLPTTYLYTGLDLPATIASTELTNKNTITFNPSAPGTTTWTAKVTYKAGEQPLTSLGNNYESPLPAGTTSTRSISVKAMYPIYATTMAIDTMTKQPLRDGAYMSVVFVAETDTHKQRIAYANTTPALTGVEFFNPVSNKWEWLAGSKANSLIYFDETEVLFNNIPYRNYTNNSLRVGPRELRFYTN